MFVLLGLSLSSGALAATIAVNTTSDSRVHGDGICTFREALENANQDGDYTAGDCASGSGHDEIVFNIPTSDPGIYLVDELDEAEITAITSDNTSLEDTDVDGSEDLNVCLMSADNSDSGDTYPLIYVGLESVMGEDECDTWFTQNHLPAAGGWSEHATYFVEGAFTNATPGEEGGAYTWAGGDGLTFGYDVVGIFPAYEYGVAYVDWPGAEEEGYQNPGNVWLGVGSESRYSSVTEPDSVVGYLIDYFGFKLGLYSHSDQDPGCSTYEDMGASCDYDGSITIFSKVGDSYVLQDPPEGVDFYDDNDHSMTVAQSSASISYEAGDYYAGVALTNSGTLAAPTVLSSNTIGGASAANGDGLTIAGTSVVTSTNDSITNNTGDNLICSASGTTQKMINTDFEYDSDTSKTNVTAGTVNAYYRTRAYTPSISSGTATWTTASEGTPVDSAGDPISGQTITDNYSTYITPLAYAINSSGLETDNNDFTITTSSGAFDYTLDTVDETATFSSAVYVDATSGNDSTGAGTSAAPYATIAKALTTLATSGTIHATGTFTEQVSLTSSHSGTSGSYATIQAWSGQDAPVINATGNSYGFSLAGAQYIEISGFTVQNATSSGIYLSGAAIATLSDNVITSNVNGASVVGTSALTSSGDSIISNTTDNLVHSSTGTSQMINTDFEYDSDTDLANVTAGTVQVYYRTRAYTANLDSGTVTWTTTSDGTPVDSSAEDIAGQTITDNYTSYITPLAYTIMLSGLGTDNNDFTLTASSDAGASGTVDYTLDTVDETATFAEAVMGGMISSDITPPSAPAGISVSLNSEGAPVVTWTDPADLDLGRIDVLRGIGSNPVSGTAVANIAPGVQSYTESGADNGTIYTYALRGVDTANNYSDITDQVSITAQGTTGGGGGGGGGGGYTPPLPDQEEDDGLLDAEELISTNLPTAEDVASGTARLVKSPESDSVYLVDTEAGTKQPILNAGVFEDRGFSWADIEEVGEGELAEYSMERLVVQPDSSVLKFSDNRVYEVRSDYELHWIPDEETFLSYHEWPQIEVLIDSLMPLFSIVLDWVAP